MLDPVWLVIGAAILLVSVFFFVKLFKFRIRKKVRKVKPAKPARKPAPEYIRNSTLKKIDKCIYDLSHGRADVRESYQNMSTIMRAFVTDMSGKDVTTHTLTDLKASGDKVLSELIEKWYAPEFAMKTKADFMGDANEAKHVVKRWN